MTAGFVVAAPRSGAGKTTVALGLMRAFARRGLAVQPFKCGPDYIDPAFHRVATGRPSFNLDGWAMDSAALAGLVEGHAADLAIAEGVMGLFDGVGGRGATADIAALLGWPVVLVLDVKGQTETAAAIALGCASYRPDVAIAGVILNRVASARHLGLISSAFDRIGVRLFGALSNDPQLTLPERHLGLVQAGEMVDLEKRLDLLAKTLEESVDLDALLKNARPAGAVRPANSSAFIDPPGQRVALASDRAFSFMYPHLLEHWRARGAEIRPFSPLADEAPASAADAVWLPGGYPELHAFGPGDRGCRRPAARDDESVGPRDVVCQAQSASRLSHCAARCRLCARAGGNHRAGPRVSLCFRAVDG
jgi:cobyrinic acid a,c-diamide synthase